jgi:hypothetical protein
LDSRQYTTESQRTSSAAALQNLQMMSNISKMLYDTATAVIRKIGG